jgi:hypothetical protein
MTTSFDMDIKFSKKLPKVIHTRLWGCNGYPTDTDLEKRTKTKRHAKRYTRRWLRRNGKSLLDEFIGEDCSDTLDDPNSEDIEEVD